jgi:hypothetical protein
VPVNEANITGESFLCIAGADLLPQLQFHAHDRFKLSFTLLLGRAVALLIAGYGHAAHGQPACVVDDGSDLPVSPLRFIQRQMVVRSTPRRRAASARFWPQAMRIRSSSSRGGGSIRGSPEASG